MLSMSSIPAPTSFSRTGTSIAASSLPSRRLRKSALTLASSPSCFLSGSISLLPAHLGSPVRRGMDSWTFLVRAIGKKPAEVTKKVFLDVKIGQAGAESKGERIVIGLYGGVAPKTVENFLTLCTGKKGFGYKGSKFDPIIKGHHIQADICGRSMSRSNLAYKEDRNELSEAEAEAGNLTMVRQSDGYYRSQFRILTSQDPRKVDLVFGAVIKGMEIVKKIEKQKVSDPEGHPKEVIQIINCGQLPN